VSFGVTTSSFLPIKKLEEPDITTIINVKANKAKAKRMDFSILKVTSSFFIFKYFTARTQIRFVLVVNFQIKFGSDFHINS
jgi:hypothetical protein